MLSNTIIDFINGASGGFGLTKGVDLFAEQSRGDKHILVGVTTTTGDDYVPTLRKSGVNILITGWGVNDGFVLSTKIANKILEMEGGTFTFNNGSQIETYEIGTIAVRTWPVSFNLLDKVVFTTNIEFHYKQTAA